MHMIDAFLAGDHPFKHCYREIDADGWFDWSYPELYDVAGGNTLKSLAKKGLIEVKRRAEYKGSYGWFGKEHYRQIFVGYAWSVRKI